MQQQPISAYMACGVPVASAQELVGQVRERLASRRYASVERIYVVDPDRRFLGTTPLDLLLIAAPDATLGSMLTHDQPTALPGVDREEAASLAIRRGADGVVIVDGDGHFLGVVSGKALIAILRDEHLEDLHHMAGVLHKSQAARDALTAAPLRRVRYRLPWLMVGMAGSALATGLMVQFEDVLKAHIAVAFFVPAIVYLADAVGTQTEAVAVRSLSLVDGGGIRGLLYGELITGMMIGMTLGIGALPIVWLAFGQAALAVTVAVALFVASSIAASIGLLLPWSFAQMGIDPAHGSGPLATVVQDVLSLVVYLSVARILVF
jgi:magnesium transporter